MISHKSFLNLMRVADLELEQSAYTDICKQLHSIEKEITNHKANIKDDSGKLKILDEKKQLLESEKIYLENRLRMETLPIGEWSQLSAMVILQNLRSMNIPDPKKPHQKTELLVLAPAKDRPIDRDLLAVIKMRERVCREKGAKLIVMPFDAFNTLMCSEVVESVSGITKLSFLHHSGQSLSEQASGESYAENVGAYAKKLPDLKDIVLRGCGTASVVAGSKSKTAPVDMYSLKIVEGTRTQHPQGNQLLIQQTCLDGVIKTTVAYREKLDDSKSKIVVKNVELSRLYSSKNIRNNDGLLSELSTCRDLPSIKEVIEQEKKRLKATFFDKTQAMPRDERKMAKDVIVRAGTQDSHSFICETDNAIKSIAERVEKSLKKYGCDNLTVKAYIGGYKAGPDRVIPSEAHGQSKSSKAIRVTVRKSK